ncbi:MAG: MBL fold metallo-hydrolase [Planctomycetota bacterium]
MVSGTLALVLAVLGAAAAERTVTTNPDLNPYVVVLGVAQDGGAPHAGCQKDCCAERWRDPTKRVHVTCLGIVDPAASACWLIDATPDFPVQLRRLGDTRLAGVLLTHAHIGHYTGLVHLGREVMGARSIPVYAMPRLRDFLGDNGPWDQLVRLDNIALRPLAAGEPVELSARVTVTPFLVPHRDEYSETVGFRIDGPARSALYISDIDKWHRWDRRIEDLIAEVDVAWLDGTFYDDAEVPGRSMDEIPHPFITESMQRFEALPLSQRSKVRFIHLNHTNPALNADSAARKTIEAAGFRVADELERFDLAMVPTPGPTTRPTSRPTTRPATGDPNPPAPGFDVEGSDEKAIEIADAVMEKMGGRRSWDRTRYLRWSFFGGSRHHVWDKHAGRVRIERMGPRSGRHYVRIIDLNTGTGRTWREGEEITAGKELDAMIKAGVREWINDSYWLVMPYKLKDAGVTLRSLGRGEMQDGRAADVLELTFSDVGHSPQNKYHIWVADDSGLVQQWAYFADAADAEPAFVCPWRDWKRYGRIMLSGDRGELNGRPARLNGIAVLDELPESVFTSPDPVDWAGLLDRGGAE